MSKYTPDEILRLCGENLRRATNLRDLTNICMASRLAWQEKEMGGIEHVQFAQRNSTPIVPPGHCCHPLELVKRGYIDGTGWPKPGARTALQRVEYFRWPDGAHTYASLDGKDVVWGGRAKFNTQQEAEDAAREWIALHGL